ncbi:Gag-pol Polyprotein [Phytophthora palmivora]|uniref:Gag-pol Polyprotein n=1 Tax=Phytophthora palmivora TaxID=4796 RepID=A0A2P4YJ09_9STRA|nr:Gag-pol Polyprotein [Phytophthora palmivora]
MLLILAFLLDLDCCHVDFVTAFLNGELKGVKIYMEQPEYFDDGSGRVCELLKGLYGLKQASRLWYQTLHKHLLDIGFTQCDFDVGLYQHWKDGRVVYVTVYVDDLLIAAKKEDIEQVIEDLSNNRSVTGYLLRLNGCTFLYKSKQQAKVTTATCSSELIAASACVDDMIWARKLLKEIRGESPPCSKLFMDNQSTIMVATEPGNYKKMKRFAKLSREIAEFVKKDKVQVEYVPSAENVADIFTKALGPQRFQGLRQALNVEDVSTAIPVQHE